MPDTEAQGGNSQTLCTELADLQFETMESSGGHSTVIRFRLDNRSVRMGDVLLVLEGDEIRFHGLIGSIDEKGWAVAADRRGSTIPCAR
jgi:hypothetical protein